MATHRISLVRGLVPLALAAGICASAGARAANDLLADWQAAVTHDPQYAAALASHEAGLARGAQGRALWRPSVSLGVNAGWAEQRSTTQGAGFSAPAFGSFGDVAFQTQIDHGTDQGWNLVLQQPLFSGQRSAASRQLELQATLADAQWRAARQDLILHVAQAHLDVLAARAAVRAAQADHAAAERALSEARERYDSGAAPITEMHEAQARRDTVAARLLAAQDALVLAQSAYTDVTGLPGELAADLPEAAAVTARVPALDEWLRRARDHNPRLEIARLQADLARAEVKKFSAVGSASLDLVARAGEDRLHGNGPYTSTGSARYDSGQRWVGLQLTVPLYTGGMRSARQTEAAALAEAALSQVQAAQNEVAQQTRAAWLAVSTGAAQVAALDQARASAALRLDATRTGLEAGDRTMLDLLDAERERHAVDLGWEQARQAVLMGRLRLAASAGMLDEQFLGDVDRAFLPATRLAQQPHER